MAKKSQLPEQLITVLKDGTRHDLVILAVPSHDRNNRPLSTQPLWAKAALELFADLFVGATSFTTFEGIYKTEDGRYLRDKPIMIESYADHEDAGDLAKLKQLDQFIRRMKREMDQECVLLVLNDYRVLV